MLLGEEIKRQEESHSALLSLRLSSVQVLGAMEPGVSAGVCTAWIPVSLEGYRLFSELFTSFSPFLLKYTVVFHF